MPKEQNRLLSLDLMRGITVAGMILVNNPGSWSAVYAPFRHAPWNGLTPTDLIFPFFIFIMGVSLYLSMRKYEAQSRKPVAKILRRTCALFAIGLALDAFSKLCAGNLSWENLRILGVMQRLALAYAGGAFLMLFVPPKYQLAVAAGILALYTGLLQAFDGYVHAAGNLVAVIDRQVLGASHLIKEYTAAGDSFPFEPEGLLSTLPCWSQVLFGVYAGRLITGIKENRTRIARIAVFGTALLFAGFLWGYLDPINKKLWTASYALVTSGFASLFFALLIEITDVRNHTRWSRGFEAFGTNPLFMYVVGWVLSVLFVVAFIPRNSGFLSIRGILYNRILQPWMSDYPASLAYAFLFTGLVWLFGYWLYRKRIYIKL